MSEIQESGEYRIIHDFSYARQTSGNEIREHSRNTLFTGMFSTVDRVLMFVSKMVEKNRASLSKLKRCDFEVYFLGHYLCTLNLLVGRGSEETPLVMEKTHSQAEINGMVTHCFSQSMIELDKGNNKASTSLREQGYLWANKQMVDDDLLPLRQRLEDHLAMRQKARAAELAQGDKRVLVEAVRPVESREVPSELLTVRARLMSLKSKLDQGYDYSNRDDICAGFELDMSKREIAIQLDRLKAKFKGQFINVFAEIDRIAKAVGLYDVKHDGDSDHWSSEVEDPVF